MEISLLKVLLSTISRFSLLSSCNNTKFEPVQKYYQNIDETLRLLRPVLDEIVDSEIASDDPLNKSLGEFDTVLNEATELVENWHQKSSKIYFVLQIESLIAKIQTSGEEICRLVNSFLQSPTDASTSACVQMPCLRCEQTSDVIREALTDLMENTIPGSESLVKIADSLSLTSNEELLLEAVALEKVKAKAERNENTGEADYIDHMIALVMHMHDSLMKEKQSQSINGVPIPPDFCCPLSLELMSDPVILASGQTYERAFIKKWLDQGLTVCPKTRQTLSRTNLVPNYTVKALIANWCETNNIKLPDPIKSVSLNQPSSVLAHADCNDGDSHILPHNGHASRASYPRSPESIRTVSLNKSFSSNGTLPNDRPVSPSHHNSSMESPSGLTSGSHLDVGNGFGADISRASVLSSDDGEANTEQQNVRSGSQTLNPLRRDLSEGGSTIDEQFQRQCHIRSASISSTISGDANEASRVSGDLTHYCSDASGELASEAQASSTSHRETEFSPRVAETRPRSQTLWRRQPDRIVPRIVSSSALDMRLDLSGVETQVRKLIEDLQSTSEDVQRAATAELRLLAKHSMDNRIVIANCGAITNLVSLLYSPDLRTQENAVTALLNLSINDNNKAAIANADAIDPLIHVLKTGSPEAKENSAATLFSLSVIEENKVKIGRSNAIGPLVDLLGNGTPRGKKDAATALFNLSIFHDNKARIVEAGAVKYLVELMDPAAGMVDKAVAVLANLSTIPEGRTKIGQEGGIPVLVEVVELGSSRGKENAAAALLQLCRNSTRFCSMVLQEGAVPPLVALSQSGTPRAKEKAQALLSYFRTQRHGNAGRG
ncbi:RING/U-box superfamily protein with ARM repeat domain-containing protein isoform X2 [Tasmannia lanceolata]|uniref:RING/U-box superfamily protein with ARM repeat domain-containing protein isoform X2 n=1 Tax=Tasmannia lanceolata TaxID=3420 RepID=UPI0040641860